MATRENSKSGRGNERDLTTNNLEQRSSVPNDLPESAEDREKLRNEETTIDLPDVSDIPGQENVTAPPLGALADTTISSDDEEGRELFDDDDVDDDIEYIMGTDADIRTDERRTLERGETYMPTRDEDNLVRARMDDTDFQGTPLNERSFGKIQTGFDLDTDTTGDETRTSSLGQGDEENKYYSLGSNENESLERGMDEQADYRGYGSELKTDVSDEE